MIPMGPDIGDFRRKIRRSARTPLARILSRAVYSSFRKGAQEKMDKYSFEEKIQAIDERMKKSEETALLSAKNVQKDVADCYDLIAGTRVALATQAGLIANIQQMLVSLKASIEKLKAEKRIIRSPLISSGRSEN